MSPDRKMIETFGRKRKRGYVKVFREPVGGRSLVRVQWAEPDVMGVMRLRTESFDDTRVGIAEAKAFALGKHEGLTAKVVVPEFAPISANALYGKYVTAKETEWADNTIRLSRERWGKFELFIGRDYDAASVKKEHLDRLKKALLVSGHVPNQVRHILKEVVRVFSWGVEADVIPPTKLTLFKSVKFRKDVMLGAPKMAEYSLDERQRIIAALDPRKPKEWRPWVVNTVLAYCGPRIDATLHLEVSDVELALPVLGPNGPEYSGTSRIHWRAETNKTGKDWWQPIPGAAAEALWVALGWRQLDRYEGRFLFYGAQRRTRAQGLRRRDQHHSRARTTLEGVVVDEKPWTYSAFIAALHRAETRAGITAIMYRGAHAHRRGVAGDIHAKTGSSKDAANYIGDDSIKVVERHYLLMRDASLERSAGLMEPNRNVPQQPGPAPVSSKPDSVETQPLTGEPAVGIEPTTARLQDS